MVVAARLPVAPPLFMGAIGVFSTFDISSPKIRPVTSAKPPAGKATTISMRRAGYFSRDQDRVVVDPRENTATKARGGRIVMSNRVIFLLPYEIKNQRPLSEA